jgi:hypothetical protein
VAQGYTQIEGLDFGETYASVARLEEIRVLLAYACAHNIKLYKMDVKCKRTDQIIRAQVQKTSAETLKFLNLSPYNPGSQSKP